MPFKNRIFFIILVIVGLALGAVLLAPIAVSNAVRIWVGWFARQQGFVATIDGVSPSRVRLMLAHLDSCGAARRGGLERRYFGCRGR